MQLFNPLHSSCAKPPKRCHACPGHFSFCPSAFQSTTQPGRAGKGIGPSRAVPGLPLLQTWKLTPPGPRLLQSPGGPFAVEDSEDQPRRALLPGLQVAISSFCRRAVAAYSKGAASPSPPRALGIRRGIRPSLPGPAPGLWPRPSQRVSARRLATGQGRSSGRWTEGAGPGSGQKPGSAAVSALGFCRGRVRGRNSWSTAGIARVCACGVNRVRAVAFPGHRQRTFSCR